MEFAQIFNEMSWIVILLFVISIGFAVAECLIPGFGVCGIMSILCGASSIVVEGIFTKSIFAVLLVMVIMIVCFLILFCIFAYSAKKGFLRKKTPIILDKTAVSQDFASNEEKKLLIGRVGVVVSDCKPVGKADFEGKMHTIISKDKNLEAGKLVFVEEIRDNLIFVKELKGGENE